MLHIRSHTPPIRFSYRPWPTVAAQGCECRIAESNPLQTIPSLLFRASRSAQTDVPQAAPCLQRKSVTNSVLFAVLCDLAKTRHRAFLKTISLRKEKNKTQKACSSRIVLVQMPGYRSGDSGKAWAVAGDSAAVSALLGLEV